ncbi:alpha/beta fold hydrolase [Arenibacterium halophilum]|uniref:Alpha/beta fold hydrolase n=2 Tax=Arenibacterium halophilum TaxID=2583821 RepID=A0ABY2XD20_9RHOB|nr:alpha/beta fold hydrolase [Arenibacterium halophilum]
MVLPASRKARALLGFLVATGRPHRRERLCDLLWDLPSDPRAALRWAMTKLRKVVDTPGRSRIAADRERVAFVKDCVRVDTHQIYARLAEAGGGVPFADLEVMAGQLEGVFLDGLDNAGDDDFAAWLMAEREDARLARLDVLRRLAAHPDAGPAADKWRKLWRAADPSANMVDDSAAPSNRTQNKPAGRPDHAARARRNALKSQRIGFCEAEDGAKIAFASVGDGPPLLKAANWLNHLEFDWASPIWGRSFAELARFRSFIRYDERGCGLSDWDVADLGFDAFVSDLEAVADKLGLERFPLLGISQGCAVSIEYAVRHPERVSGLILFGGYAAGWRHLASPEEQARREAVLTLTKLGWGTDNPAYRHIFSKTFMPDAGPEVLDWFDDFQRQTASPDNAARFQDAFGHIDVRDRLAQVRVPTLVLHSRHDQRIPLDMGRAIASAIPDAQFVVLESKNHILLDHEPAWRKAYLAIGRFLAEHGI